MLTQNVQGFNASFPRTGILRQVMSFAANQNCAFAAEEKANVDGGGGY